MVVILLSVNQIPILTLEGTGLFLIKPEYKIKHKSPKPLIKHFLKISIERNTASIVARDNKRSKMYTQITLAYNF